MRVPALRFPEFEGEWEEKRIGDIARFKKGKGISKADIAEDGALPCVRYGELYTTYGRMIEELQRQTENMGEDLLSHVVHDTLARVLQKIDLEQSKDETSEKRGQEEQGQSNDAGNRRATKRLKFGDGQSG